MSTLSESKNLLRQYSIARIPFVAINTIERARSLCVLKEVAEELNLPFYVHTLSKGVYDLATEKVLNEDKSVYGAIDFMSEQMKRKQYLTLILTEIPDISSDNSDARQILDLVTLPWGTLTSTALTPIATKPVCANLATRLWMC